MSLPYAGRSDGYKCNVTRPHAELGSWAERVHRDGIQLNMHACGDVAPETIKDINIARTFTGGKTVLEG